MTRYGTGKLAKEIIDRMEKLALYMEITLIDRKSGFCLEFYLDALFTSSEMYSNILLKLYCKHALVTAIAVNLKKITAGDL